ncbi:hypothetical protein FT643_01840 [Ketobacter sp. MCCC 1A13808]|uniref:hypothetical protein n=1 Tax=Ketobacter sp. MCCC 1A13808 TaxID=2602738 RepID=UPI000F2704B8|nr:hypothetical protein [Ketobacter sp. MCCC 1A13808]MVF10872.1 hypothetical protein [Ketobacter sp. MCCC 1A13808]RLP56269.1 MAG: hypothetical protein D6160_02435 [Ketobacter sp.]
MSGYSEPKQSSSTSPTFANKENRVILFGFVLVLAAIVMTGFVSYLNYKTGRVSGEQLIQAQQVQEQALARAQAQYAGFLDKQARVTRFEKSFMARQQHYAEFMAALSDTWLSVNRKDKQLLEDSLQKLAKSYYALEPFLEEGGRHYLQKRIAIYHNLAQQLLSDKVEHDGLVLEDKATMNRMLEDFQSYLYPLLFKPFSNEQTQKGSENERN